MDESWVEAILKKHENDNQMFKIVNFQRENAVPKGVNYSSVITRVKFDVLLNNGRKKAQSIILKVEHKGKKADVMDDFQIFKVETKVYRDCLGQMELLMDEFNDRREIMWCQMLGYQPYNTIILEDLAAKGFALVERRNALGLNEGKLILKSLGRFHAMSKVLMDRGIIAEGDLPPFNFARDLDLMRNMMKHALRQLGSSMRTKWPEKWKNVAEHVSQQEDLVFKRMNKLALSEKGDSSIFKVLNHGDPWTCNFMFKHDEESGLPISMRFLDFQVCHTDSYMWDVLYFLYTSVRPDLRRQHLHDLYQVYLSSLSFNLKFFGYAKDAPTFEEMLKEADRLEYFTLICLGLCFPAMTADSEEAFDLEKVNDPSADIVNPDALSSDKFINLCGPDFEHLVQKGVI